MVWDITKEGASILYKVELRQPSRSPDWPSGRIDWKAAQQEILSSHWVHRIQKLDFPQLHQLSEKKSADDFAGDFFGRFVWVMKLTRSNTSKLKIKLWLWNLWTCNDALQPAARFLPKRSEGDEMDVQGAILPEETEENLRRGWCEWAANFVLVLTSSQSWWCSSSGWFGNPKNAWFTSDMCVCVRVWGVDSLPESRRFCMHLFCC